MNKFTYASAFIFVWLGVFLNSGLAEPSATPTPTLSSAKNQKDSQVSEETHTKATPRTSKTVELPTDTNHQGMQPGDGASLE